MKKITYQDIKISDYECSLVKLTGKEIKDVYGYICDPFGDNVMFQITKIVFKDDIAVFCEGEHDCPYLSESKKVPNIDDETLGRLYEEQEREEE